MKMRSSIIVAGISIFLILAVGWFFGIGPQLSTVASTNTKRSEIERQNLSNEAQLTRLKREYENMAPLQAQLAELKTSVPGVAGIPNFVSELNALASANQVTVKSIAVSDARPYVPAPAPAAGSSGSAPSAAITNAKITTSNFVLIPVQFSISGDYSKVLDFVRDVQNGQRLFLISTFTSAGSTDTKAKIGKGLSSQIVDASIGGFIYVILNLA